MMLANPICWQGYTKMLNLNHSDRVAEASLFHHCVLLHSVEQVKRLLTPHRW